jgi:hypothetical protein
MAFASTIQPVSKPVAEKSVDNSTTASLLSMLVLSVYAAQKSKKSFRKLKRKFLWTAAKLKFKSFFSKKAATNDQVLIYILIGIVAIALIFVAPVAALVLALVALILILAGVI